MRTIREALVAVRELLTPENAWTTNFGARDASGEFVVPYSPSAVCWCLVGALDSVVQDVDLRLRALREVRNRIGGSGTSITGWNDAPERTHADVLNLLDQAIAEAPDAR